MSEGSQSVPPPICADSPPVTRGKFSCRSSPGTGAGGRPVSKSPPAVPSASLPTFPSAPPTSSPPPPVAHASAQSPICQYITSCCLCHGV